MNDRLLLPGAAVAYALGIKLSLYYPAVTAANWFQSALLMGFLTVAAGRYGLPPVRWRLGLVVLLLALLGATHGQWQRQEWAAWVEWLSAADYLQVYGPVLAGRNGNTLEIHPEKICRQSQECVSGWIPTLRLVQRSWVPNSQSRIVAGSLVAVSGSFHPPKKAGNPGEFDEAAYALQNWSAGSIQVESWQLQGEAGSDAIRNQWGEALRQVLPGEEGALVRSVVLGGSSEVSADTKLALERCSLSHITSVSGMHIGLVTAGTYLLLRSNQGWRGLLGLLPAVLVLTVAGARPSTLRAVGSAFLLWLARTLGLGADPWIVLCAILLIVLAVNPAYANDVGLILSFSAVAGILLISRPLLALREKLVEHIRSLPYGRVAGSFVNWSWRIIAVTIGAQAGTSLFVANYFNTISLVGPVANLFGFPLVAVTLGAGLLGLALYSCGAVLIGESFLKAAGLAGRGLLAVTHYLSAPNWAAIEVASPPIWAPVAWWVILFATSAWLQGLSLPRAWRGIPVRSALRYVLLGLAVASFGLIRTTVLQSQQLHITFFDINQGDAILVQVPGGHSVLIDAGGASLYFDASETLVPQLKKLGVRELLAVVNTHPHTDHIGGMAGVLRARRAKVAWDTGIESSTKAYANYKEALSETNVQLRKASAGDQLRVGKVTFEVLWPPTVEVSKGSSSLNDLSLVLRISYGSVEVLLMGDLPANVQNRLASSVREGSVVLWKVPHQGAADGWSESFFEAASPQVSVISVGPNGYGHPNQVVVQNLMASSTVCRTDEHGAIRFTTNGSRWWVRGSKGNGCREAGRSD